MKQVYDSRFRKELARRKLGGAALLAVIAIAAAALLAAAASCVSRGSILLPAALSALILTAAVMLFSVCAHYGFLYDLALERLLRRVGERRTEEVRGRLVRISGELFTREHVTFRVYEFDCGDRHHGETVLRRLYIEQDCEAELCAEQEYRMAVVDNMILSYEVHGDEAQM